MCERLLVSHQTLPCQASLTSQPSIFFTHFLPETYDSHILNGSSKFLCIPSILSPSILAWRYTVLLSRTIHASNMLPLLRRTPPPSMSRHFVPTPTAPPWHSTLSHMHSCARSSPSRDVCYHLRKPTDVSRVPRSVNTC